MTNEEIVAPPPVFQDRKTLLVVFGILQIFLDAICVLMVPLMMVSLAVSKFAPSGAAAPMNPGMMMASVFVYMMLAVWFIWVGIGSIKARRWARALILVSAWIWLIVGVIGGSMMLLFTADMFAKMLNTGQMPQAFMIIMKVVMAVFMFIFLVLIPGALILVYGRKNVKMTTEFYDREVRWTDKCPLPVLGLVLLFGFGAVSLLNMVFYGRVVPVFGSLVNGLPGLFIILAMVAVLGYLTRGLYRLDIRAWWAAIVFVILVSVSVILTFSRVNLLDLYAAMDFSAQQIELMKQYGIQDSPIMKLTGLWGVPIVGYLLFIRKYFVHAE